MCRVSNCQNVQSRGSIYCELHHTVLFTQPMTSALCLGTYCITQVRQGHTHCDQCENKQGISNTVSVAAITQAKKLYYKHMKLCPITHDFMWGQCAPAYQAAWIYIAEADVEEVEDNG